MFDAAQPQVQENLFATFFVQPVRMGYKSEQAGHDVYEDVIHVRIKSPGDNLTEVVREATELDKRRFAHQWAYFQQSQVGDEMVIGMPVTEWAAISRSLAEELKGKGFKTVESLANASDLQLQSIMGGSGWRTKAQAFLKQAEDSALVMKQANDIKRLEDMISNLNNELSRLGRQADDKPRRGRPPKEETKED